MYFFKRYLFCDFYQHDWSFVPPELESLEAHCRQNPQSESDSYLHSGKEELKEAWLKSLLAQQQINFALNFYLI